MVSGPFRPERPKPPVHVEPTYNTVLHREAPRAQFEQAKRQFESALLKADSRSTDNTSIGAAKRGSDEPTSAGARTLGSSVTAGRGANSLNATSLDSLARGLNKPRAQDGLAAEENTARSHSDARSGAANAPLGKLADNPQTSTAGLNQSALANEEIAANPQLEIESTNTLNKLQPSGNLADAAGQNVQASDAPIENQVDISDAEQDDSTITASKLDAQSQLNVKIKSDRHEEEVDHSGDSEVAVMIAPAETPELPASINVAAPGSSAHNAERFETIDKMLNHLSVMDARSGPREWHFEIQNQDSAVVSISVSAGNEGGWHVTVESDSDNLSDAKSCLHQLEEKFKAFGDKVESLQLREEQTL